MSRIKEPTQKLYKQAVKHKDQAISIAMKRKEEFLGARVPGELRQRVINRANELGIPVSILIRNILEQAFEVSTENNASFSDVIAWEKVSLNRAVSCNACTTKMLKGQLAYFGAGASKPMVLCPSCAESQ